MCNSLNHHPDCNCGFGPKGGNNGLRSSSMSSGLNVEYSPGCFMTNCYWCGDIVHFIRARSGGCFLADSTQPWVVHPCWSENKSAQQFVSGYLRSKVVKGVSIGHVPRSSYDTRNVITQETSGSTRGEKNASVKARIKEKREFISGETVSVRCKSVVILDETKEYTMILCRGVKGAFHGNKFVAVIPANEMNNQIKHYGVLTINGLVDNGYYWKDMNYAFIDVSNVYARKLRKSGKQLELDSTITINFDE